MSERYYIHGDEHENLDKQYYCAICDSCEYQDHFLLSNHINANLDKYHITLGRLKTANPRFLKVNYRPKNSHNLFAHLQLQKPKVGNFYRWLKRQKDRDDPIGDLANEALTDEEFPKDCNSLSAIDNYLNWRGACSEALQALFEAFNEFKKKNINREGISLKLRFEIFRKDNYKCRICSASAKDENTKLEVDHMVPVVKGGTNDPSNLWTLCFKCNRGKNTSKLVFL